MEQADPFDGLDGLPAAAPEASTALTTLTGLPGAGLPVGQTARQVRTQYVTAVSVPLPRDLRRVEESFLLECAHLGSLAYYSWGTDGKDHVEGPSINLALAAARCFGNCAVEPLPVESDLEAWYFRYAFIDLETGFTLIRPFRQSRAWTVHGKFDEARKEDIRFQIGASKAMRNVILNALPEWLLNRGLQRAKQGERQKIEAFIKKHGLEAAQQAILQSLAEVGADSARVLARLERPTRAAITVEDMVRLRGDLKALQLGAELLDNLFPAPEAEAPEGPEGPPAEAGDDPAKAHLRRRATQRPNGRSPEKPVAPEDSPPPADEDVP